MKITVSSTDVSPVISSLKNALEQGAKQVAQLEQVKARMSVASELMTLLSVATDEPTEIQLSDKSQGLLFGIVDSLPHGKVKALASILGR